MNRQSFPTLALLVSVPLVAVLIAGGGLAGGPSPVPLLALLLIAEFGLIINAVAAYLGVGSLRQHPRRRLASLRLAANMALALGFGASLFAFWPL